MTRETEQKLKELRRKQAAIELEIAEITKEETTAQAPEWVLELVRDVEFRIEIDTSCDPDDFILNEYVESVSVLDLSDDDASRLRGLGSFSDLDLFENASEAGRLVLDLSSLPIDTDTPEEFLVAVVRRCREVLPTARFSVSTLNLRKDIERLSEIISRVSATVIREGLQ